MTNFYVGHGRRWNFLQEAGYSEDALSELLVSVANSPQAEVIAQSDAGTLICEPGEMAIAILIAGNKIESAFPYFRGSTPWPVTLRDKFEWPNCLEANRTGDCHGALLHWFDPCYVRDRHAPGQPRQPVIGSAMVRMNALAYAAWRTTFSSEENEERMGNMKAYFPLQDQDDYEASGDEIQFMSHVEEVRSLDFHRVPIDVYAVTIALPDEFSMRLNVYTPRHVVGEVLAVGERITGVCWLSGELVE